MCVRVRAPRTVSQMALTEVLGLPTQIPCPPNLTHPGVGRDPDLPMMTGYYTAGAATIQERIGV